MPKCDFNKVAKQHGCFPVNLLHIFRIPFPKNTSERLLLQLPEQPPPSGTLTKPLVCIVSLILSHN